MLPVTRDDRVLAKRSKLEAVHKPMKLCYALRNHCHLGDLSYVIGVLLGDATVYESHKGTLNYATHKPTRTYTIELRVKDREFAEMFAVRLDKVLHRPDSRRHRIYPCGKYWRTCVRSLSFGEWWQACKINAEQLELYALKSPGDFLAGIYDSNGNLGPYELRIFTVDTMTRDLIVKACEHLGLRCRSRCFRKKGTLVTTPNGPIISNIDLLVVHIGPRDLFFSHVHPSIARKVPASTAESTRDRV